MASSCQEGAPRAGWRVSRFWIHRPACLVTGLPDERRETFRSGSFCTAGCGAVTRGVPRAKHLLRLRERWLLWAFSRSLDEMRDEVPLSVASLPPRNSSVPCTPAAQNDGLTIRGTVSSYALLGAGATHACCSSILIGPPPGAPRYPTEGLGACVTEDTVTPGSQRDERPGRSPRIKAPVRHSPPVDPVRPAAGAPAADASISGTCGHRKPPGV